MMNKIEKIDKDIVALVITVDRGGMGAAEWSRQAQRNGEVFKKMFPDLKVIVIPDTVTVESFDAFGVIEKLSEVSPDIAKLLADPQNKEEWDGHVRT